MSLILEALRKSEAERRRGQAPNLFDVPAPVSTLPPTPARVSAWWAVPVLIVLALALMWWRSASHDEASASTPPNDTSAVSDPALQADTSSTQIGAADGDATSAPVPPLTPDIADPAASSPARIVTDAPRPLDIAAADPPGVAPSASVQLPSSSPPPAPVARSPEPGPPPVAAASTPSAIAAAPAAVTTAASANALLRLADLTATERSALPPLRMSMHLWAPESAGRFVILDGVRVAEGDRVGTAVVDEITPDGVVLAWQGRRLKLPVR